MKREVLLESLAGETRMAVLEDGVLAEYYTECGRKTVAGNLYAGHVENVLPGMEAAFVDIGLARNAFLHAGDIGVDGGDELRGKVGKCLPKRGQEILVQVIKEPVGSKGARVSCHVTLPGRLLVLLPTVCYAGVSRKISCETERARLREIADGLCSETGVGMIVRTSAEGEDEDAIRREHGELLRLWQGIRTRASHAKAPALVHRDDNLVDRAVRDFLGCCSDGIYTDSEPLYRAALDAAEMLAPCHADKIRLRREFTNLFDAYQVDKQLKRDLARQVWLKSGGYLVFDHTEALTVIDVNTGKFVGKTCFSDTVFETNCEAAREIARLLRLRDIGGIIVVDFIDMDSAQKRESLLTILNESLRRDRTHTGVAGLTRLGLVEMTRKKVRCSVTGQLTEPCARCGGTGRTHTADYLALSAIREAVRIARSGSPVIIAAPEPVAHRIAEIGVPKGVVACVRADGRIPPDAYHVAPVASLPAGAGKIDELEE